ncbi:MAG: Gfo/Idh/MocA family oxidoreductase [Armatimonadetes bacterium]|nr:Gfo/Idh/MocA family oxidoreductase [Armatimonadota bacterium]
MSQRLSIAIAGGGRGRGQIWPATVSKLSDLYDFRAMIEPVPERAEENRQRWGVAVYPDVKALLDNEKIDVLLVAVPPDAYHPIVCTAAEYGVHAITEIPFGPTGPIARMMAEAAAKNGVKLGVAENVYRWATERLKQKILSSGIIGRPKHARLWYTCGCYHGFNAIRMLLGSEPTRVMGYAGTIPVPWYVDYLAETVPEEAWEVALIEFSNGCVCLYEMPPPGFRGNHWEVECEGGALDGNELVVREGRSLQRYSFQWEYEMAEGEKVLDHVRVNTDPPIVWENPFKRWLVADNDEVARVDILVDFHRAVSQNATPDYPPEKAWPDQEIWIALRESALHGSQWVELPLRGLTEFEKMMHEEYARLYGRRWDDIEGLRSVAFPRGGVRWTVGRQL